MPKTSMKVHGQLIFGGKPFQRLALPDYMIALDVAPNLRGQNKETSVDPATIPKRLFLKTRDAIPLVPNCTEPTRRLSRRHSRKAPRLFMQFDCRADVNIADAVAVCDTKGIVTLNVRQNAFYSTANLGILPGI